MAAGKETKKPTETRKGPSSPPYDEWREGINIHIGTCGYSRYQPIGNWKERYDSKLQAYSDAFAVVEDRSTFVLRC
jgi:hypothetical protein